MEILLKRLKAKLGDDITLETNNSVQLEAALIKLLDKEIEDIMPDIYPSMKEKVKVAQKRFQEAQAKRLALEKALKQDAERRKSQPVEYSRNEHGDLVAVYPSIKK